MKHKRFYKNALHLNKNKTITKARYRWNQWFETKRVTYETQRLNTHNKNVTYERILSAKNTLHEPHMLLNMFKNGEHIKARAEHVFKQHFENH